MSISVTVNREHKSTLFCYIFGAEENKKYLLSLYNAVNDTSYTNIEDIEINTIADFIYIRMKNDVSFIFDCDMIIFISKLLLNYILLFFDFNFVFSLLPT